MLTPSNRSTRNANRLDRRTVLRSLCVVGTAGLAGCLESVRGDSEPDGETIVWNGEGYEYSSNICSTSDGRQTQDVYVSDSSLVADPEYLDFWVRFDYEEQAQLGVPGYRVLLHLREEAGSDDHEQYVVRVEESRVDDEDLFSFDWGESEERHTSGSVHLEPDNELAEEANPDGGEVEWDISC